MSPKVRTSPIQRLTSRIEIDASTGCWHYTGVIGPGGYGLIGEGPRGGRVLRTHRVTYEYFKGPIPAGYEIDHLCRTRDCCNPEHLEAVTRAVNVARGMKKSAQTRCAQGHEFTPENTKQTSRQRVCITCARRRSREHAARKRLLEA